MMVGVLVVQNVAKVSQTLECLGKGRAVLVQVLSPLAGRGLKQDAPCGLHHGLRQGSLEQPAA